MCTFGTSNVNMHAYLVKTRARYTPTNGPQYPSYFSCEAAQARLSTLPRTGEYTNVDSCCSASTRASILRNVLVIDALMLAKLLLSVGSS